MSCQQIAFEQGECLVEIRTFPGAAEPRFTAELAIVEDEGAIVRPLVSPDGHVVQIHATSESLALASAITFLEHKFGHAGESDRHCALGGATIGRPFLVEP